MFYKPDYTGKSIVNLMSSISKCFNSDPVYRELDMLPSEKIKRYKNIVHIVIDGLGYNYLMKKRENFLKTHTAGKITSVFPSTTSACITSFATGLAPKEHGVTGWFVRIKNKNVDIPSTILLFNDRRDGELLTNKGIVPSDVFTSIRLSTKIPNLKSVLPSSNISSVYTDHMLSDSTKIGYDGLEDFFDKISESVRSSSDNQNYIYGYLPDFDSILHEQGSRSESLSKLFYDISRNTEILAKNLRDTNSVIIITADHGLIDGDENKRININQYPDITEMLSFPLCGEPRAAYCYVKERYKKNFKSIVTCKIGHAVKVFTRSEIINGNFMGLYQAHPDLETRVGDFILLCKDNYVVKDFLDNEEEKFNVSDHGGLSSDEMFVPLVVIPT